MTPMPTLETLRLRIRPFTQDDLHAVYHLLDVELRQAEFGTAETHTLEERAAWLQWTVLGYTQLPRLYQPPYGERAVVHKATDQLIGVCGFVPCLDAFEQLAGFAPTATPSSWWRTTPEVGLFYAFAPAFQRQGYATEAAQALVDYAFRHLRLKRIVATTTFANAASIGVMRKLGMDIRQNHSAEPPWLQVVGVLSHDALPANPVG